MFHSARWKAYLENLRITDSNDAPNENGDDNPSNIYQIFHSQMLWFTRDETNGHGQAASEHLERCDSLLQDCTSMVDALEETLANTPKPSEVLDWRSISF